MSLPCLGDILVRGQSRLLRIQVARLGNYNVRGILGRAQSQVYYPSSASSIDGKTFSPDAISNTPASIFTAIPRRLYLQPNHPIAIVRQLVESCFPPPTYTHHRCLSPAVTVAQNFDTLGFPPDHPGRSPTDTYYLNKEHVLRTHSSAHEAEIFQANKSDGYTISADVYRRDAIDRSHYPVFHQIECARTWDRTKVPNGNVAAAVRQDLRIFEKQRLEVEDPNPTTHPERNPLQAEHHSAEEVEAVAAHLKRSIEAVVLKLFATARQAIEASGGSVASPEEPLKVRWIEAYFPFTSPSWELEVLWQGDWLEVLGCGVTKQEILIRAGVPNRLGWAFGIGLDRIAMLLYNIPDIRLFWSQDQRFLSQFTADGPAKQFVPFSRYPACYKDVAFWLRSSSSAAGGGLKSNTQDFHENDVMEIIRDVGGGDVEDVKLKDEFTHPVSGRKSLCYRINYRSLERTLTNERANALHNQIRENLVNTLGVELR